MLTIAAADVLPPALTRAALAAALVLLAESFGRDVVVAVAPPRTGRRRARSGRDPAADGGPAAGASGRRRRRAHAARARCSSGSPSSLRTSRAVSRPARFCGSRSRASSSSRWPSSCPRRARRVLAWVVGPALGLLVIVKLLDVGFFTAFDRPFNPVEDWSYASIGIETLRDSIGRTRADLVVAGVVLITVAALVLPTLALLRLTRVAAGNRRLSIRAVTALGVAWVLCWVFGAQLVSGRAHRLHQRRRPGRPRGAARCRPTCTTRRASRPRSATTATAHTPGNRLLTGLRGKDVLLVFVESYGKVAVQGSSFSPGVDAVLDAGTTQLAAAGFSARSGWLTSPTFGGTSWLAHSTMQSGVWVDSQGRYDAARRRAIGSRSARRSSAPAGGPSTTCRRTTGTGRRDRPSTTTTRSTTGATSATAARRTPTPPCPTSTSYSALQRLELAKPDRRPLFAEVDLVSSHEPWTPHPAADRLERGRRRLDLQQAAGRHAPVLSEHRAGATAGRSSTRCARCSRSCSTTAARTSCWSCWATTSRPRSSPDRAPATTCRSRSSPTTRRC